MIDVHCHFLPGMDDGPRLLKETTAMAKAAADQGIDTIIATPHHNNGKYINERMDVVGATEFVNAQIQQLGIPVEVLPGQEIYMYEEIVNDLQNGLLLPMNQSTKYVLIEMPDSYLPPYTDRLIFDLQVAGYIPVIAHPERNIAIAEHPDMLLDMVKNGAVVQADARSLLGGNGKKIKKLTQQMIDANLVHLIGSNAHTAKKLALADAFQTLDGETSDQFMENSEQLLWNKPIIKDVPEQIKKSSRWTFWK